jgi:hypothetical protein
MRFATGAKRKYLQYLHKNKIGTCLTLTTTSLEPAAIVPFQIQEDLGFR